LKIIVIFKNRGESINIGVEGIFFILLFYCHGSYNLSPLSPIIRRGISSHPRHNLMILGMSIYPYSIGTHKKYPQLIG
jgi:hypothetical protein